MHQPGAQYPLCRINNSWKITADKGLTSGESYNIKPRELRKQLLYFCAGEFGMFLLLPRVAHDTPGVAAEGYNKGQHPGADNTAAFRENKTLYIAI